jgi:hypothetical protein
MRENAEILAAVKAHKAWHQLAKLQPKVPAFSAGTGFQDARLWAPGAEAEARGVAELFAS